MHRKFQRSSSAKKKITSRLCGELLEDRHLLALVLALPPVNPTAGGVNIIEQALDTLPVEIHLPAQIEEMVTTLGSQVLDAVSASTVYQAFAGEVNEVDVWSDLFNTMLVLNESEDVSLIRAGLPFQPITRDILDVLDFSGTLGLDLAGLLGLMGFANLEGALSAEIGLNVGQLLAIVENTFDLTHGRAIVPNATALLELLPSLKQFTEFANDFLNFDITNALQSIDIDPIISIDLSPLPTIEIPPHQLQEIDLSKLLDGNLPFLDTVAKFPKTLQELLEKHAPEPVKQVLDQVKSMISALTNPITLTSLYVSTLDGPDSINLERLTGKPVQVYAGADNDVIRTGGGVSFIESFLDPLIPIDEAPLPLFEREPAKIELFGEQGQDTFIIGPRFNSLDLNINGGSDVDLLVVEGTPHADIIKLFANDQGELYKIEYHVPDPNQGEGKNEKQIIRLPNGTSGGTFALTFQSRSGLTDTTDPIAYNASAADVEEALSNVLSIGEGDAQVRSLVGGGWSVEFTGALGQTNVQSLLIDTSELTKAGAQITVIQTEQGNAEDGNNEIQTIALPREADQSRLITGGTFTLTYLDPRDNAVYEVGPIRHNADRVDLRAAFEALDIFEPGDINVQGSLGGPWRVEFTGSRAMESQFLLVADGSNLTGGVKATVVETQAARPRLERVTLPAPATGNASVGGVFTLSFGGESTSQLRYNASAAEIQNALENLTAIGVGNVSVSLVAEQPRAWDISLRGPAAAPGAQLLGADPSLLTGGTFVQVQEVDGFGTNEIQTIIPPVATGGSFKLAFDNDQISRQTEPLPYDATVGELQAELERLASVGGRQNIIVGGSDGGPWTVEFTGTLAAAEQNEITVFDEDLEFVVMAPVVTTVTPGNSTTNAVQQISQPLATGGTFAIQFEQGPASAAIPFNATAGQVRSALEGVASIGPGNVSVMGPEGGPWQVEFINDLGNRSQPNLVVTNVALTGLPTVGEIQSHVTGQDETQTISLSPMASGGSFRLTYGGETTELLPFDATAAVVQAALESLPSLETGQVQVSSSNSQSGPWTVTFGGRLAKTNVPLIHGDASLVSGGFAATDVGVDIQLDSINEQQTFTLSPTPQGGVFQLRLRTGGATTDVPFDATADQVRDALEALPAVGVGNVLVTSPSTSSWNVEFTGKFAGSDVPDIVVDDNDLSRNEPLKVSRTQSGQLANGIQRIMIPADVIGGSFTVTARPIKITETQQGDQSNNETQVITLPVGALGGAYHLKFNGAATLPIAFDASAAEVKQALQALPTIAGAQHIDVRQLGVAPSSYEVTFQGKFANGDVSLLDSISEPTNSSSGLLGPQLTTAPIEFDTTREVVSDRLQQALAALPALADNVVVTYDESSMALQIEFTGDLAGTPLGMLEVDGSQLQRRGNDQPIVETRIHGGDGRPVLVSTKELTTFVSVEQLRIEAGGGADTIIFDGMSGFPLEIFVDGGDGGDSLEIISHEDAPSFQAGPTLTVDGVSLRYDSIERGITFDAQNKEATFVMSGDRGGNDLRLSVVSAFENSQVFARDAEVQVILKNAGQNSELQIDGDQGDDVVSVDLAALAPFSELRIDGGGPFGADSLRLEGTALSDSFDFTPDINSVDAGRVDVTTAGALHEFTIVDMESLTLLGRGGVDSLTVGEAAPGAHDNVLYAPQAGNDGLFRMISQFNPTSGADVGMPVTFQSLEDRLFATGSGTDTLTVSTDDLPGVNSDVVVTADSIITNVGELVALATVAFGDQATRFQTDLSPDDLLSLELGTVVDRIVVNPGPGTRIDVNAGVGPDHLLVNYGEAVPVSVELQDGSVQHGQLGEVIYTGIEYLELQGNADLSQNLDIQGTDGEDTFRFTSSAADRGTLITTATRPLPLVQFAGFDGAFTVGGGQGFDQLIYEGTAGRDLFRVDSPKRTVERESLPFGAAAGDVARGVQLLPDLQSVVADGRESADTFHVVPSPLQDPLLVEIRGGTSSTQNALLLSQLDATGFPQPLENSDFVALIHARNPDTGSLHVYRNGVRLPSVNFQEVPVVSPLQDINARTQSDAPLLVLGPDMMEANDLRATATVLGSGESLNVDNLSLVPNGLEHSGLAADQDFFQVTALHTGTMDFSVSFRTFAGNMLPGAGDVDIAVLDNNGHVIGGEGTFGNPDADANARVRVPVVSGQTYYLHVFGHDVDVINAYALSIVNEPAPAPYDLELIDLATVSGAAPLSDTGRSQLDNVTRDSTPVVRFRLDDAGFLHDVPGNPQDDSPLDEVIPIPFNRSQQLSDTTAGYRVAVFVEGPPQQLPVPQQLVGFARQTAEGVYEFDFESDALVAGYTLSDGSHFISARTMMTDPAAIAQTGLGPRSSSLEIVVDTTPPPVVFGVAAIAADGLHPDADSSVAGPNNRVTLSDRITSDSTPTFWGTAEADSIVRVYLDTNLNNLVDPQDVPIGLTTAEPLDGSNAFPNGQWQITSTVDLNSLSVSSFDGLRQVLVEAEDLAGNVSAAQSLEIFVDSQGPRVSEVFISGNREYDLFAPKPEQDGPTPVVRSLSIRISDLPNRVAQFLYDAVAQNIAEQPGHYQLVGDATGVVRIVRVIVDQTVAVDQPAEAVVTLTFEGPLPDDRYTLSISDNIVDPARNRLDGESDLVEPQDEASLPSGDGQTGGAFEARFTVDSRPEVATYLGDGTWYVDLNGNGIFDPDNGDSTNRDIVWKFGTRGDLPVVGDWNGDGFDEIGVLGKRGGRDLFFLDLDRNGAFDPDVDAQFEFKLGGSGAGNPVAGDWDADGFDEVATFQGSAWFFDHSGQVYTPNTTSINPTRVRSTIRGIPVVGDWDGDGDDNVGAFDRDHFLLDTDDNAADGELVVNFPEFDFGGLAPQPVAHDWDQDGDDNLGLFVPRETGSNSGSREAGEWFLDVNTVFSGVGSIDVRFEPPPTGLPGLPAVSQDIFLNFGDEREPASIGGLVPVVGNFDPPAAHVILQPASFKTNPFNPLDVDADQNVSPLDALLIIGHLNELESATQSVNGQIFLDVNADGVINPLDALLVINALNQPQAAAVAVGEPSIDRADSVIGRPVNLSHVDSVMADLGHRSESRVAMPEGLTHTGRFNRLRVSQKAETNSRRLDCEGLTPDQSAETRLDNGITDDAHAIV